MLEVKRRKDLINTMRLSFCRRHFQMLFVEWKVKHFVLNFVSESPFESKSALALVMAWHLTDTKPSPDDQVLRWHMVLVVGRNELIMKSWMKGMKFCFILSQWNHKWKVHEVAYNQTYICLEIHNDWKNFQRIKHHWKSNWIRIFMKH